MAEEHRHFACEPAAVTECGTERCRGTAYEVLRIIRRLGMEADLEGPVPDDLQPLTRAHGGPLTDPLPGPPTRISALSTAAVTRSRELLISGAGALLWTDVEETLGASGYRPGAVSFAGEEKPATIPLRRSAQLAAYWSATFPSLHALPGAGVTVPRIAGVAQAGPTPTVRQFAADNGSLRHLGRQQIREPVDG